MTGTTGTTGDALGYELAEVSAYVLLHARNQGIGESECRRVLAEIAGSEDGPDGWAGAWAAVWGGEAERCRAARRPLDAIAREILAGFPTPATAAQRAARDRAIRSFADWATGTGVAEPVSVDGPAPTTAWYSAARDGRDAPVVLIIGGIVSPKEQWGRLLPSFARFGLGAVVTELPGVGPGRYGPGSPQHLSAVLDAVGVRPGGAGALCLAMSHGGTLALRAAAADPRIRGIVSVGAPVRRCFRDALIWRRTPAITREALAHTTGVAVDDLPAMLPGLAVTDAELDRLRVPVRYLRSLRDELVPPDEAGLLIDRAGARVLDIDDVHGSPHHVAAVRGDAVAALLEMARPTAPSTRALRTALTLARLASPVLPIDLGKEFAPCPR